MFGCTFYLKVFEFTTILAQFLVKNIVLYFTQHAFSHRPSLPPLFSLTLPKKKQKQKIKKKTIGTSHKRKQAHAGMDCAPGSDSPFIFLLSKSLYSCYLLITWKCVLVALLNGLLWAG